jgi:mannose-6-phosphate isomerase-like protein (cupin superfamily)
MDLDALLKTATAVARANPVPDGEPFRVTDVNLTPRSTTAIASIRAGGGLRPHIHHEHDEIIVFLEGEADFRIGDRSRLVRAGDVVTVPAGVVHATYNAHTDCLVAAVFAPFFDRANEDREYVD